MKSFPKCPKHGVNIVGKTCPVCCYHKAQVKLHDIAGIICSDCGTFLRLITTSQLEEIEKELRDAKTELTRLKAQ